LQRIALVAAGRAGNHGSHMGEQFIPG